MRCGGCGAALDGRYVKVGARGYHRECFRCQACRLPIGGPFQVERGAFLHPECWQAQFAPRCVACQQAVGSRYVKSQDGRPFHPACFQKAEAPHCVVCAKGVLEPVVKDPWGHTYCARHRKEVGVCAYCDRLTHRNVGGGGLKYPDGRVICRGCRPSAVDGQRELQGVVRAVQAEMASWGVVLPVQPAVVAVDRSSLVARLTKNPHAGLANVLGLAMNREKVGPQGRSGHEATVHLLTGLPLVVLEAAAAHELFHVWCFGTGMRHAFNTEEGACNLMSDRILAARPGELAAYRRQQMQADPHPAYGAGFRRVARYAQKQGLEALLQRLRHHKDLPLLAF